MYLIVRFQFTSKLLTCTSTRNNSVKILIFKPFSNTKDPGLLGEMSNSRTQARNIKDELEHLTEMQKVRKGPSADEWIGVFLWHTRLRIQCCSCSLGHYCGVGLIIGLGTSTCCRCGQIYIHIHIYEWIKKMWYIHIQWHITQP